MGAAQVCIAAARGSKRSTACSKSGSVSIHDDRETVPPWGINGGLHGGTSSKWLQRAGSDERERIPSKIDNLKVEPGDRVIFITAGSGGWGDPLDRDADQTARDVSNGLVSIEKAARDYGVVILKDGAVDAVATEKRRKEMRAERGPASDFDFGHIPGISTAAE